MSRGEKLQWAVIFAALASMWARMIWPHLVWRIISWVMLGVLAGMFIWKMVLFHRRVEEAEKEGDEHRRQPPTGGGPPCEP